MPPLKQILKTDGVLNESVMRFEPLSWLQKLADAISAGAHQAAGRPSAELRARQ